MGEMIPFPERREEEPRLPFTCGGVIHVFDAVPGRCQCGEEFWTPSGELAPPTDAFGVHEVSWEASTG